MVLLINYNIGLIRVMTSENKRIIEAHGDMIEKEYDGLRILSLCIQNQYEGIYNTRTEKEAIPKILKLSSVLQNEGVKSIIISCAADPGLNKVREKVRIPIIGAGSAAAYLALSIGGPVGVIGITSSAPDIISNILRQNMMTYLKIPNIKNASNINNNIIEQILDISKSLKTKGAKVILLACAGLSNLGISNLIYKKTGLITVDPVSSAGIIANKIIKTQKE